MNIWRSDAENITLKVVHYMTEDVTLLVISFSYRSEEQKCSLSLQILHGQNWELLTFGNQK